MLCPRCARPNPEDGTRCLACGADLAASSDMETFAGVVPVPLPSSVSAAARAAVAKPKAAAADEPTGGTWDFAAAGAVPDEVNFGPRYKIQRLLGQGGMGAVYKAYDTELDRTVALKLIRPDVTVSANVAARFKQELLLASRISHKNILRIHDLGDAAGVKFISMAYVEGQDLHGLLTEAGKLPLDRALNIARQLCAALEAAHTEGVVHRDLKPHNILLNSEDHVYVSDFGLAKSLESDTGMTQSGELLGTPRYMAPEQVLGKGIDHRVDIYALGLILYEMVTGEVPFQGESTIQLMYKRVHEAPRSPKTISADVPDWLVRVIMKCLEREPGLRYQQAGDILRDLEAGTAPVRPATVKIALPKIGFQVQRRWAIAVAVALLAVALLAIPAVRHRLFGTPAGTSARNVPVTVLVADFSNHTGDAVFDGSLEPMINVALEGASFINAFSRNDARKVAAKLPNPSAKLDEQTARLVAVNQGLGVVLTGTLERQGSGYELLIKAVRALSGETLASTQVQAAGKEQVLFAATKAAIAVRKALGDTTPESEQLFALETLTATSLEAVHEYSLGFDDLVNGKNSEAVQRFSRAVDLDPNFGLAYSGKASALRNLGQDDDAIAAIKEGMRHIDRMTERERSRIRGTFYMITHNDQKCVEEYTSLASRYTSDAGGLANLAICYSNLREMSKAVEATQRAADILPKRLAYRFNLAILQALAGDFPSAERQAKTMLEMQPGFDKGHMILALALLAQNKLQEAEASYHNAEKISPAAASVAAAGLADLAAYQGRFADSVKILNNAAAADLEANRPDRAAEKYVALANVELWRDRPEAALAAAEKALANSKVAKIRFAAAVVFAHTRAPAKARELAAGLSAELLTEPQAYGKLIEGEIALKSGDARDAIKAFTDANNLLNTWIGHFDLGRAYLQAGAFAEADSEFDLCARRRGEALLVYMDDVPTYAYFPAVYYYEGRVHEGLRSPGSVESYRQYLSLREKAGEDPLLPEIRRRIAAAGPN